MNKKQYKEFVKKEAEKFKITPTDLHNIVDLGLMMPHWFVKDVLKPNKMDKWFIRFTTKAEKIVLIDAKEKKK